MNIFLKKKKKLNLQSLIIAAVPNIIGWLAISFAKVSLPFPLLSIILYVI